MKPSNAPERGREREKLCWWGNVGPGPRPPADPCRQRTPREKREPGWAGAVEIQTAVLPDQSPRGLQTLRDTKQALSCQGEPAGRARSPRELWGHVHRRD